MHLNNVKEYLLSSVGERLKEERKRLGMSQSEFAEIGGVKKLAQLKYEKGERSPSYTYIENLRKNRDINVDYILTSVRDGKDLNLGDYLDHGTALIRDIVFEVEKLLVSKPEIELSPIGKAGVVAILYRIFFFSGEIDIKLLEETVFLARENI